MSENLLLICAGYIVLRELFFFYQVHKLLNKLMSRNYFEYETSKRAERSTVKKQNAFAEEPPEEDLAHVLGL